MRKCAKTFLCPVLVYTKDELEASALTLAQEHHGVLVSWELWFSTDLGVYLSIDFNRDGACFMAKTRLLESTNKG